MPEVPVGTMRDAIVLTFALLALFIFAWLGSMAPVQSMTPRVYAPLGQAAFTPLPSLSSATTAPAATATPKPAIRATPRPTVRPRPTTSQSISGQSTTYCRPQDYGTGACMAVHPNGGHWAAAGPALRAAIGGGDHCAPGPHCWRDVRVWVCSKLACTYAVLADWCACGSGHVIDLYGTVQAIIDPNYLVNGGLVIKASW